MTSTYLSRSDWGALSRYPRRGHVVPVHQFRGLVVHHTVSVVKDWDGDGILHGDLDDIVRFMKRLQVARPDLGLDVPYSFVVFRGASADDVVICEGRGMDRTGAHTEGRNSTRWGVAVAGNTSIDEWTPGLEAGVLEVGGWLTAADLKETTGHRDWKNTECPGDGAYGSMSRLQPEFFPGRGSAGAEEDPMFITYDMKSETYRVHVTGAGYATVDEAGHWQDVVTEGRKTGLYESEWMDVLLWKIAVEEEERLLAGAA